MEKTGEYLYSKKELKNSEIKKEGLPALNDPIGNVEYVREGNVCVENEKLRFEFSYSFAEYRDYVRGPDEVDGLLGFYPQSGGYRKLNSFVITDKKTNKQIDILDKLPEGYCVLFNPFLGEERGSANVLYKGCVIAGDISSIRGVLTILHEIGHCVSYEKSEDKERYLKTNIKKAETEEDLNFVLSKEWTAWFFALNKIRPLLSSGAFPKKEVFDSLHGKEALLSYCEVAREALNGIKLIQTLKKEIERKKIEDFESKLHELTGR
jgi:hypothetical protein